MGAVFVGLLLGGVGGYLLGRFAGRDPSTFNQGNAIQSDRVIEHFDFDAAIAWASEEKWTLKPSIDSFPLPPAQGSSQFYPAENPSKAEFSISSLRYLSSNGPPLTADEQSTFFARFTERLSLALGNDGEQPVARSGLHRVSGNGRNIYHHQIEFYTIRSKNKGTVGNVRGTAAVWMVADDDSTSIMMTLTEAGPSAR
jgi:hypothetical protein